MYTFIIALAVLVAGFFLYGTLVEKVFGINPKAQTPAVAHPDGVDYVPMSGWRIFLVQFLNIAGLGPIFGAIMGIFFGPAAFLWIVLGTIFGGGVHDYMAGMLSVRKNGASMPEIVKDEIGSGLAYVVRIFILVLLVLLTTTFMTGPAALLQNMCPLPSIEYHSLPLVWLGIIFLYYTLATLLPVDKLIGRFYPIFGAILLFMGLGIMVVMLGWHSTEMPELSDGLYNRQTNGLPIFPMMFVSIACGAISGFHSTQSPLMARCMTNERQGRWIFYGAMVAEGILALIWAAAAGTFFAVPEQGIYGIDGLQAFAAQHPNENIAALVVDKISKSWLGQIGGFLAVLGVVVAPITSGDTALRSARLTVADFLHIDQKPILNRLKIALPLFAAVFGMAFVDFNIVWRYFSWTNQTISVFILWSATLFLYSNKKGYGFLITLIPALFMTMVSVSYIFMAPEGLDLDPENRWIGYVVGALVCNGLLLAFVSWTKYHSLHHIDKLKKLLKNLRH